MIHPWNLKKQVIYIQFCSITFLLYSNQIVKYLEFEKARHLKAQNVASMIVLVIAQVLATFSITRSLPLSVNIGNQNHKVTTIQNLLLSFSVRIDASLTLLRAYLQKR